mgnify:CR=1 FL=1
MRGVFIVIDGLGGSGKTTQLTMLKKRLGRRALFTHEPGGAPRAERIRDILKSGKGPKLDPLTDFFLFWAARAEHVGARIKPALRKGKIVISDRFDSSTFAMQVRGDEQKTLEKLFWQCREHTLEGCMPDLYVILDASISTSRSRRRGRGEGEDRFDEREEAYQKRVRAGYKEFAKRLGKRALVLDAAEPQRDVNETIVHAIEKLA